MEMEMRARDSIEIGQDLTPPLAPMAFSLYDTFLSSHCSSCFSPLSPPFFTPTRPTVVYCSPSCSLSDQPLHFSSGEFHLLQSLSLTTSHISSSDLCTALRLLHSLSSGSKLSSDLHRIAGLMTNRDRLLSDGSGIREGAAVMAKARRRARDDEGGNDEEFVLEEAALCLVITNAVEVHDKTGRALGIAVYDSSFSWINHTCSPNACYSFMLSSAPTKDDSMRTLLVPHIVKRENIEVDKSYSEESIVSGTDRGLGPRVIVRSIKKITKGEEVTVSYIDLMQPKAMRQLELWSKYQFTCCCTRCIASPVPYVDAFLEEIYASKLDSRSISSTENFCRDEATRKIADYIDEAVNEYLSFENPESCCRKLEVLLAQGLSGDYLGIDEEKPKLNVKLHPLNHLALKAYTTLASVYRVRSALYSDIDGEKLQAFDFNKISAAYSLLLAGATQNLFLSESSLIASAADFWTSAGDSLVTLARSTAWFNSFNLYSLPQYKCTKCPSMDVLKYDLSFTEARKTDLERISSEFMNCITTITQDVWNFLVHGFHYLQLFKDPIDFSWVPKSSNILVYGADFKCSGEYSNHNSKDKAYGSSNEKRLSIFKLGVHCLLYGRFLANICYGQNSDLNYHIPDLNVSCNLDKKLVL